MERDHIAYALAAAYKRGEIEGTIGTPIGKAEAPELHLAALQEYTDKAWVDWIPAAMQVRSFEHRGCDATPRIASNEAADNAEILVEMAENAKQYDTCMALSVDQEGGAVELVLDTSRACYLEWIRGEGGDIGLLRDQETKKVVGCRLPLKDNKLSVFHAGPLVINDGFRKDRQG